MFNESEVYKFWDIFRPNNQLTEIRLISNDGKIASGYFTDPKTLIDAVKPYAKDYSVYFTINKINPDCYGRPQKDKIVIRAKNTTTDSEIIARDYVLLDLDSKRATGVNATEEQLNLAKKKANVVYKFLIDNGFYEPIVICSGSGVHIYIRCALLPTEENNQIIKRFTQAMSMLFSDNNVDIDEKVFNLGRISRVCGYYNRKGSPLDKERPQRLCTFAKVPNEIKVNQKEYFEKIAKLYPEDLKPTRENNYRVERFDLQSFLQKHNIRVTNVENVAGGKKYILEHCPFNENHKGKDAVIFQRDSGEISFHCFHNSCSNNGWRELRLLYEPDAYDKRYNNNNHRNYTYDNRPKPFVPQVESDEKGKKWLSMKDIKQVKSEDILVIPTGYYELDKKIMGLSAGELTILSGLNSCVDCDTEYFNGKEWKKISEYKNGDKVLQYNTNGSAELVYPQRYIKVPCNKLHLIKTQRGINQCICDEHNIVYQTSKGNLQKKKMKDMIIQHSRSKHGFNGKFYTTFKYNGNGIELTDEQIRVMCAVICDGTFKHRYKDKNIVRLNLKKQRKKERLEKLLKEANIEYRKEQYNPNDLEFNNYLFKSPRIEKEFGEYWYNCNSHQLKVITEEVMHWDGYLANYSFSSTSKKTIDFIQFAFASIGKRTSIYIDNRVGRFHSNNKYTYKNVCYVLNICSNNMVSMINTKCKTQIKDYQTKDGYKYCFSVPSGMLVLRRGGNINITGNCGKTSWLDCLALNTVNQGFKVGIWSGEMQDWRFKNWISQIAAGKNNVRSKQGYDNLFYVPNNISEKINTWLDDKLFLYNNSYGMNWQQLFNDIKELVDNKGVHLILLDNLATLNISDYDGEKNTKQTKFIVDIKEYAKQKNIHVIVVAHPRKENFFLRKESVSGTADLTNLADNVFLLHRVTKDFETRAGEFFGKDKASEYMKFGNVLEVAKNREHGVVDLLVGMYFEVESRRLKNDVAEHIVYGWNEEYTQTTITPIISKQENEDPLGVTSNVAEEDPF